MKHLISVHVFLMPDAPRQTDSGRWCASFINDLQTTCGKWTGDGESKNWKKTIPTEKGGIQRIPNKMPLDQDQKRTRNLTEFLGKSSACVKINLFGRMNQKTPDPSSPHKPEILTNSGGREQTSCLRRAQEQRKCSLGVKKTENSDQGKGMEIPPQTENPTWDP